MPLFLSSLRHSSWTLRPCFTVSARRATVEAVPVDDALSPQAGGVNEGRFLGGGEGLRQYGCSLRRQEEAAEPRDGGGVLPRSPPPVRLSLRPSPRKGVSCRPRTVDLSRVAASCLALRHVQGEAEEVD